MIDGLLFAVFCWWLDDCVFVAYWCSWFWFVDLLGFWLNVVLLVYGLCTLPTCLMVWFCDVILTRFACLVFAIAYRLVWVVYMGFKFERAVGFVYLVDLLVFDLRLCLCDIDCCFGIDFVWLSWFCLLGFCCWFDCVWFFCLCLVIGLALFWLFRFSWFLDCFGLRLCLVCL